MERIARSMNFELIEGATDAVIKKTSPDRGGNVEPTTAAARSLLFNGQGGYGHAAAEAHAHDVIAGVVRGT
jgi:hypothetical protein